MKYISLLTPLVVIVGIAFLTYSKLGLFNFAQGSDSDLHIVRSSPWVIAVISAVLLLFIAFLIWYPKLRVPGLIILIALIFVWIINGRVVGMYSDGRIIAGWFFVRTEVVNFREPNEFSEQYISHMLITARSKWNVEIRNREHRAKMFVGPIIQKSLLKSWRERGYKVMEYL